MILILAHHERQFKGVPQLDLFGHFAEKTEIIDRAYDRVALSLITSGNGCMKHRGKTYAVEAPCAFMVHPGEDFNYGPDATWEETFYTYRTEEDADALYQRWGIDTKRILWPVRRPSKLRRIVDVSLDLSAELGSPGTADQLDRLAEMALVESLWGREESHFSTEAQRIRKAEAYIRDNYRKPITMSDLLAICNFSTRTFRRYWNRSYNSSPVQLVNKLRLDEAANLLIETGLGVAEIAYMVGFEDPLYFSKRFTEFKGASPRSYRAKRVSGRRPEGARKTSGSE